MNRKKKPLYRKVNTRTHRVDHDLGGDFKYSKNKKRDNLEIVYGSMHSNKKRGLDYTPLFKFLLSRVGQHWDDVFSEAKSRLDQTDPIFWMVAIDETDKKEMVRTGESSYFSGLFVDNQGILQLTNPQLTAADLEPYCSCCTHTFNGKLFGQE